MKGCIRALVALVVACTLAGIGRAQFLSDAVQTITLSLLGVSGSTPMNIAWHPSFEQYYGGRGSADLCLPDHQANHDGRINRCRADRHAGGVCGHG
ncbi:MAG: hypothetical protein RIS54_1289 [Verrucomicrobiota bacterium]|jgi:hypothetical protein